MDEPVRQPQPRTIKSTVVAEFVDAIPTPQDNLRSNRTSWQSQPGSKEGLMKAMQNPGRAMLFVEYNVGSPSKRKSLASLRAKAMIDSGYNIHNGWTVKAVGNQVYVMYQP